MRQELLRLGVEEDTVQQGLEGFDAWKNAYRAGHRLARSLKKRAIIPNFAGASGVAYTAGGSPLR